MALRPGLRSARASTLRRCQILLASEQGLRPSPIALRIGGSSPAVRDTRHAFADEGTACVHPTSKAPKTIHAVWPKERDDELRSV
jgi:hypothetical protein